MPAKRGRPVSTDTVDPVILERRRRTTERVRQLREHRRTMAAVTTQITVPQLQQADAIAECPFEEIEAEQTVLALGLRVQNIDLPQDISSAQLQQDTVHVEEHNILYDEDDMTGGLSTITGNTPNSPIIISDDDDDDDDDSADLSSVTISLIPSPDYDHNSSTDASQVMNERDRLNRIQTGVLDNEVNQAGHINNSDEEISVYSFPSEHSRHVNNEDELNDNPADYIPNSDEETSVYSFTSEHSQHTDDEDEPAEISAHDYAVQKLHEQLQGGFHGCSEEQHEEQLRQHVQAVGENHHSLDNIFNDPDFPSVLALPGMITADNLAQQPIPTPAQWQAMFCGIQGRRRSSPIHVCLHKEETQAVEPQVGFDIDSFLGFASSLAIARQGLWYQPAPQMRQNMTNDVHLETNIFQESGNPDQPPRPSLAMLRDVPHFLLGRVVGAHDITVHVLFPHLVQTQDKFVCLTNDQLSRWLDQVFHPAVYQYCEAHYTQHLPASYQHALANSMARRVEDRKVETTSYQAQQSIGYHLQPEYLGLIWTEILNTITNIPGLADFREPQLFFSAKGTKLQFKTSPSQPTMLDAMENFEVYFERVINLDFVHLDRFYVDLGKEICPSISLLRSQQRQFGDEPQVYAWKRCCLQHYMQWMYDGQPPAAATKGQQYFEVNMLYDACDLTSVTPKRSKHREGGIIYSQFYASVKEISDAVKCKPFDNDGLEELALDPQIRQAAHSTTRGHRRDIHIIERAYCASKHRAQNALRDSKKKSFGIREEHRITWRLFQGLLGRLQLEEDREELEVVLVDCPSYTWAVKTEVYLRYLWRSADKFATGFEVVRVRCNQELVTWEQTKIMAMFLRCLRFVFGGHLLQMESALWWSRRERWVGEPPRRRLWYGLGFCNTLPRYKYCWLEPRIDWNRLTFRSEVTDNILFGNNILRGQYLRRGGLVQDFFATTRRLELALEWMEQHHENAAIRDRLILWIINICLQQFRVDVLGSVKSEILEEYREEAMQGRELFCYGYLLEIMGGNLHLISGNRCEFKQPRKLGHFLFHFDDGRARTHWENKPYRKLYQRAVTGLRVRCGGGSDDVVRKFKRRLQRGLFLSHWILPYPCAEVLTQTTKQGQRMWYSIKPAGWVRPGSLGVTVDEWEWGRKSWQEGRPGRLPEYVWWSKEQWVEWIETHR